MTEAERLPFEPPRHGRFDLTIECEDPAHQRRRLEDALRQNGVDYELWGSSQDRLRYEVTLPRDVTTLKLTKIITRLTEPHGGTVEWSPLGNQHGKRRRHAQTRSRDGGLPRSVDGDRRQRRASRPDTGANVD
jgi:hypothetical protein